MLVLAAAPLSAAGRELKTIEVATNVLQTAAASPLKGIPPTLLREAAGVAIIPHVVRVGILLDHRVGHGIVVAHEPGGRWSNPGFITLEGNGIGPQAGIESTDLVLVFRSKVSLEKILKGRGKLRLGGDVGVAAGPIGHEAEGAPGRRAEVYCYSRSRGLFAGLSLEGDRVSLDSRANKAFYGPHGARTQDILVPHGPPVAAVEALKGLLTQLSGPPAIPLIVPVAPLPPPHKRH
jgi:lipid-binding SYLF domain-containing protein